MVLTTTASNFLNNYEKSLNRKWNHVYYPHGSIMKDYYQSSKQQ